MRSDFSLNNLLSTHPLHRLLRRVKLIIFPTCNKERWPGVATNQTESATASLLCTTGQSMENNAQKVIARIMSTCLTLSYGSIIGSNTPLVPKGRFRPVNNFEKFGIFSKLSKLPRSTMWKWTSTSRSVLVHFHIVESWKVGKFGKHAPAVATPVHSTLLICSKGKQG